MLRILLLMVFGFGATVLHAFNKCPFGKLASEEFFGREVQVLHVADVPTRKTQTKPAWQSEFPFRGPDTHYKQRTKDVFAENDILFVGITDSGHVYLYSNGNRSHGQGQFFAPPIDMVQAPNVLLGHMLMLEVPQSTVEQIANYFASTDKTPNFPILETSDKRHSCAHTACKQLQRAGGIQLGADPDTGKTGVLPYWPSNLVQAMVDRGFVDAEGNVIPTTVVRTTDHSLQSVVEKLQKKENRIIRQYTIIGFIPGTTGLVGYGGYLLIAPLFSNESPAIADEPAAAAEPSEDDDDDRQTLEELNVDTSSQQL